MLEIDQEKNEEIKKDVENGEEFLVMVRESELTNEEIVGIREEKLGIKIEVTGEDKDKVEVDDEELLKELSRKSLRNKK